MVLPLLGDCLSYSLFMSLLAWDGIYLFAMNRTVFSLSGLLGGARATVSGSGERSLASLSPRRPPEWQDRCIMPVEAPLPGHVRDTRGVRST